MRPVSSEMMERVILLKEESCADVVRAEEWS
jgi:hypothetical protein